MSQETNEATVRRRRLSGGDRRRENLMRRKRAKMLARGARPKRLTAKQRAAVNRMKSSGAFKKIAKLRADVNLPSTAPVLGEVKHDHRYVTAILTLAAEMVANRGDEDKAVVENDAREFAKLFMAKDPTLSNTDTGLAAVQFEMFLAEKTGLYGRFVESVVEAGEPTFSAIFDAKLTDNELTKLAEELSDFAEIDLLVNAGDTAREEGIVSEIAVLEISPMRTAAPAAAPDKTLEDERTDSITPVTAADYKAVADEGGISQGVFERLYPEIDVPGGDALAFVEDSRGITWCRKDGCWRPDLHDLQEKAKLPGGLGKSEALRLIAARFILSRADGDVRGAKSLQKRGNMIDKSGFASALKAFGNPDDPKQRDAVHKKAQAAIDSADLDAMVALFTENQIALPAFESVEDLESVLPYDAVTGPVVELAARVLEGEVVTVEDVEEALPSPAHTLCEDLLAEGNHKVVRYFHTDKFDQSKNSKDFLTAMAAVTSIRHRLEKPEFKGKAAIEQISAVLPNTKRGKRLRSLLRKAPISAPAESLDESTRMRPVGKTPSGKPIPHPMDTIFDKRMKIPKFNGPPTVFSPALSDPNRVRIIQAILTGWTKADYKAAAKEMHKIAGRAQADHEELFDKEFKKLTGKAPGFGDFRVSGIGDDRLPSKVKDKLRELTRTKQRAKDLILAYDAAAKSRLVSEGVDEGRIDSLTLKDIKALARDYDGVAGDKAARFKKHSDALKFYEQFVVAFPDLKVKKPQTKLVSGGHPKSIDTVTGTSVFTVSYMAESVTEAETVEPDDEDPFGVDPNLSGKKPTGRDLEHVIVQTITQLMSDEEWGEPVRFVNAVQVKYALKRQGFNVTREETEKALLALAKAKKIRMKMRKTYVLAGPRGSNKYETEPIFAVNEADYDTVSSVMDDQFAFDVEPFMEAAITEALTPNFPGGYKKLWVVTMPTAQSELIDIMFEVDAKSLMLQFRGGLRPEEVVGFFTDQKKAGKAAWALLKKNKPSESTTYGEAVAGLKVKAAKIGDDKKLLMARFKEALDVMYPEARKTFAGATLDFKNKRLVAKNGKDTLQWSNDGNTSRGSVGISKVASESTTEAADDPMFKRKGKESSKEYLARVIPLLMHKNKAKPEDEKRPRAQVLAIAFAKARDAGFTDVREAVEALCDASPALIAGASLAEALKSLYGAENRSEGAIFGVSEASLLRKARAMGAVARSKGLKKPERDMRLQKMISANPKHKDALTKAWVREATTTWKVTVSEQVNEGVMLNSDIGCFGIELEGPQAEMKKLITALNRDKDKTHSSFVSTALRRTPTAYYAGAVFEPNVNDARNYVFRQMKKLGIDVAFPESEDGEDSLFEAAFIDDPVFGAKAKDSKSGATLYWVVKAHKVAGSHVIAGQWATTQSPYKIKWDKNLARPLFLWTGAKWKPAPRKLDVYDSGKVSRAGAKFYSGEPLALKALTRAAKKPAETSGVEIQESTTDDTVSSLYESDGEEIRSKFEQWCVRRDGSDDGKTLVDFPDARFTVPYEPEQIEEMIERIAETYADLPEEFDVMAEAALMELGYDTGTVTGFAVPAPRSEHGFMGALMSEGLSGGEAISRWHLTVPTFAKELRVSPTAAAALLDSAAGRMIASDPGKALKESAPALRKLAVAAGRAISEATPRNEVTMRKSKGKYEFDTMFDEMLARQHMKKLSLKAPISSKDLERLTAQLKRNGIKVSMAESTDPDDPGGITETRMLKNKGGFKREVEKALKKLGVTDAKLSFTDAEKTELRGTTEMNVDELNNASQGMEHSLIPRNVGLRFSEKAGKTQILAQFYSPKFVQQYGESDTVSSVRNLQQWARENYEGNERRFLMMAIAQKPSKGVEVVPEGITPERAQVLTRELNRMRTLRESNYVYQRLGWERDDPTLRTAMESLVRQTRVTGKKLGLARMHGTYLVTEDLGEALVVVDPKGSVSVSGEMHKARLNEDGTFAFEEGSLRGMDGTVGMRMKGSTWERDDSVLSEGMMQTRRGEGDHLNDRRGADVVTGATTGAISMRELRAMGTLNYGESHDDDTVLLPLLDDGSMDAHAFEGLMQKAGANATRVVFDRSRSRSRHKKRITGQIESVDEASTAKPEPKSRFFRKLTEVLQSSDAGEAWSKIVPALARKWSVSDYAVAAYLNYDIDNNPVFNAPGGAFQRNKTAGDGALSVDAVVERVLEVASAAPFTSAKHRVKVQKSGSKRLTRDLRQFGNFDTVVYAPSVLLAKSEEHAQKIADGVRALQRTGDAPPGKVEIRNGTDVILPESVESTTEAAKDPFAAREKLRKRRADGRVAKDQPLGRTNLDPVKEACAPKGGWKQKFRKRMSA